MFLKILARRWFCLQVQANPKCPLQVFAVFAGHRTTCPSLASIRLGLLVFVVGCHFLIAAKSARAQQPIAGQPARASAGTALATIFSPYHAPAKKTMGLYQIGFLDLVEASRPQLQIAIVIDGTDSMADEIAGVRDAVNKMLADLQRYRGDSVSCAVVSYRDVGARSGPVTVHLKDFSNDPATVKKALSSITPESGAPYFYELPDLGIHEAITRLNWSTDKATSRWILLFGDAPPYDAGFRDVQAKTNAGRKFATDILLNKARQADIQISSFLCGTTSQNQTVYQKVLGKTRQFMSRLSSETGGVMLDMSYEEVRKALLVRAQLPEVTYQHIGRITQADLDAFRQRSDTAATVGSRESVTLAVLPHMAISQMSYDPQHPAVQFAAELRLKLRTLPRTSVVSPFEVRRAAQLVRADVGNRRAWMQELAVRLRADYVIWGQLRQGRGVAEVQSAIFDRSQGSPIVTAQLTKQAEGQVQLAGELLHGFVGRVGKLPAAKSLAAHLGTPDAVARVRESLLIPVATTRGERDALVIGYEYLQQALAYEPSSAEAKRLLENAQKELRDYAVDNRKNAFVHAFSASTHYNLARHFARKGDLQSAKAQRKLYETALKRAFRYRTEMRDLAFQAEIEADYELLIRKQPTRAIEMYSRLAAGGQQGRFDTALRARWMLLGIYCGDWEVPADVRSSQDARKQVLEILTEWPDSSEARAIKSHLRWDDDKKRTDFEYIPSLDEVVRAD